MLHEGSGSADCIVLIRGARVYDRALDIHRPAVKDVIVEGNRIASVSGAGELQQRKAEIVAAAAERGSNATVIEGDGKLLIPGLVNAHYHSYDVLCKGRFEDMPFDVWALHSQPAYWGKRSKKELRVRTLLGAMECLRHGITTIQDMNSVVPQDEQTLDIILSAYAEAGIRVVFSIAVRDIAALDIEPFLPEGIPPEPAAIIAGRPGNATADLAFIAAQIKRLDPLPPRLHWALSPSGPQRCSTALLEGLAELSERHALPVFTHVYETRAQLAKARSHYPDHGGSLTRYMADIGLLTARTTLAHGVYLTERGNRRSCKGRRRRRAQSVGQSQIEERRCAAACLQESRDQSGAGLRQLQLQRLPEPLPVDEAVHADIRRDGRGAERYSGLRCNRRRDHGRREGRRPQRYRRNPAWSDRRPRPDRPQRFCLPAVQ